MPETILYASDMRRIAVDPDNLSDEMVTVTISMSGMAFRWMDNRLSELGINMGDRFELDIARRPNTEAITKSLERGPVAGARWVK